MKKKLIGMITLMSVVGMLSGCGNSSDSLQNIDVEKYVTLGEYKGIEVTVAPVEVSDEELNALVASAYSSNVTLENGGITDRAVANGDTANIDYVGKKDDVAFDGGTASGYNLAIGSGQFIEGFEEGLVGVMPGETVDLNLTFPENYHSADLAGAEVVFTVTVNYIIPTEMKDEVVAGMGIEGVATVEELRQYAYDYLYESAEYNQTATIENEIFKTFMENCSFGEIPQALIDEYKTLTQETLTMQAQSYGMDAETFVTAYYGMALDDFLTQYGLDGAKQDLALQAVANAEGLNMTDEEVEAQLMSAALGAGYTSVEEYLGGETAESYKDYLVTQNAYSFIIDNAVVNK